VQLDDRRANFLGSFDLAEIRVDEQAHADACVAQA
jgi:hypothetical protein